MILLLILKIDTNLLQHSSNGTVNDKSHINVYSNVWCMYELMYNMNCIEIVIELFYGLESFSTFYAFEMSFFINIYSLF